MAVEVTAGLTSFSDFQNYVKILFLGWSINPLCLCGFSHILYLGSGLGIPTDRGGQRSWVFLNNSKNTLLVREKTKKYFLKSKTLLKIPS